MYISRHILATILSLSLFSGTVSAREKDYLTFCNLAGSYAASILLDRSHATDKNAEAAARYIAKESAYDYFETRSKLKEIVKDPSKAGLTVPEFAGFHFFWCIYDAKGVELGADVFSVQENAIGVYRTNINSE